MIKLLLNDMCLLSTEKDKPIEKLSIDEAMLNRTEAISPCINFLHLMMMMIFIFIIIIRALALHKHVVVAQQGLS